MKVVDPDLGFQPAFLDIGTFEIHPSYSTDGEPAPYDLHATVVPGFERNGFFYTHSAAARATAEWTGIRRTHVSLRSN